MNMVYDNLGEMKEHLDAFGKSGALEVDILFKAIELLEKHKGIKVFPRQMEFTAQPWADPLNPNIVIVDSMVRMVVPELAPIDFVEQVDFRFLRNSFIPVLHESDNEKLKSMYEKIPDLDYAALRIMELMCDRLKYAKQQYLRKTYYSRPIW